MFIPDGSPEYYLVNFIHYYVLLNVNNYDPNNAPRYWYQLGIDNRFHVVAATYDYGNDRRPLTGDDNIWWCISPGDSNPSYFLNRGEWYRFRIEMDERMLFFRFSGLLMEYGKMFLSLADNLILHQHI
jgi:hypothetical protein